MRAGSMAYATKASACLLIGSLCCATVCRGAPAAWPADAPRALRHAGLASEDPTASPPEEETAEASDLADLDETTRPWLAVGEVTGTNLVIWAIDRYVRQRDWARVDPEVWLDNLRYGLAWDQDDFPNNQLSHPYHGAAYFNAARANGYGFWGTTPFVLLGVAQWEWLAENEPPSVNDIVNTSLGGLALGEVLFRLSSMLLDNEARGLDRARREIVAGIIDPLRGLNRALTGEAWHRTSTPPEWEPLYFATRAHIGYQRMRGGSPGNVGEFFVDLDVEYGDALQSAIRDPFDDFTVNVQLASKAEYLLDHAFVEGVLSSSTLRADDTERLIFGIRQQFEYVDTHSYELGGQSFGFGLLYRRQAPAGNELRAAGFLRALVLGGISSEYAGAVGRSYDYGPGLGMQFESSFGRWPWSLASAKTSILWIHTLDGADGDHLLSEAFLQLDVPLYRGLGIGASAGVFSRYSSFSNFADVKQLVPRFQVFLSKH
ncbi:MAG: DUF3943 domain-containing protein [Myxococcales bacterium]